MFVIDSRQALMRILGDLVVGLPCREKQVVFRLSCELVRRHRRAT